MTRTYRNPIFDQPIRELMDFDHVVAVMPDGRVIDHDETFQPLGVHAPETFIDYDGPFAEAQIPDQYERDMAGYLRSQGWEVLGGWSGDPGPYLLRDDQFIGGALEQRIREEPGYWVRLTVEIHPSEDDPEHEKNGGNGESERVGWIVARKIGSEDEIAARTRWVAEHVPAYMADPKAERPALMNDEDAAHSAPDRIASPAVHEASARLRLSTLLFQYSHFATIRQSGDEQRFVDASRRIAETDEYSFRYHGRVYRVRAVLNPKEDT